MFSRLDTLLRSTLCAFGCLVLMISLPFFNNGAMTLTYVTFWPLLGVAGAAGCLSYWREFHSADAIEERITELENRLYDLKGGRDAR